MSKHLLSGFAREDPERFAQLLGDSNDLKEAIDILVDIPDGLEGDLISRLTPEVARRLMNELPDPVVTGWLSSCSADTARNMLARTGLERSANLVSGITDRSKRIALQRLMKHPQGTIGELVLLDVMTIRDSMHVSDIAESIQRQEGGPEAPIVITRNDGTVSGVFDLVKFLKNRDMDTRASDFCIPVKPVFADASQSSLRNRDEWNRLSSLPVVDYQGQLTGYVSRSQSEKILESESESARFLESAIELSRQFLEVMVYCLMLIFDRRSPR